MSELVYLHFSPPMLERFGLPDLPYPIPAGVVPLEVGATGELPLALLLFGLQQASRSSPGEWTKFEAAMDRLASVIAGDAAEGAVAVSEANWWLEIGPVDLEGTLVTVQRAHQLIAAIARRDDGRLRVATFRPLDAKSIVTLTGLSINPGPNGQVCLRENNWEYALDCSAGTGNAYAARSGEAYLSFWEKGIGIHSDGTESPIYRPYKDLIARRPAVVAVELRVYQRLSAEVQSRQEVADQPPQALPAQAESIPRWRSKRQQGKSVRGRFLGCLLGGAVGDALGAPVEFMSREEIRRRFGPKGIVTYVPAYGGIGRITDDTQMSLFTADGLLRSWVWFRLKGTQYTAALTSLAYLSWLRTQGETNPRFRELIAADPGWLIGHPALHSRRAPGNTCLAALRAMRTLGEPAGNDSKGCGGVMRMAPVGLFARRERRTVSPMAAFSVGCELAALTHGHMTGILPAGVLAVLVLALTDGATLPDALTTASACLRAVPDHEETLHAIRQAEAMAKQRVPPDEAIPRLGQGWVAEEALAISLYCALVARNFREGVLLAVNHDGDSDSTGSIAGNLLGAMHGIKSIPPQWLEPLELREVIAELAEDLYAYPDWRIGEDSADESLQERMRRKYPGT